MEFNMIYFIPKNKFSEPFFNKHLSIQDALKIIKTKKDNAEIKDLIVLRLIEIAVREAVSKKEDTVFFEEGYVKVKTKSVPITFTLIGNKKEEKYALLPDDWKISGESLSHMNKIRSIENITFLTGIQFSNYLNKYVNN
jgi:hypothetical protein